MQPDWPVRSLVIGVALVIGACGATEERQDDVLDPRFSGPCERLVLFWRESPSRLRASVGEEVRPRIIGGSVDVQLNVLRCPGKRKQPALRFAFVSVSISAENAPLVITKVPDDGWSWLGTVFVDADSASVFSQMGYKTESAEISLKIGSVGDEVSAETKLTFDSGILSVALTAEKQPVVYRESRALLSSERDYDLAFFGSEHADRYISAPVDINVEGGLVLEPLKRYRQPNRAVLDQNLRFNFVLWRLPRSDPSG